VVGGAVSWDWLWLEGSPEEVGEVSSVSSAAVVALEMLLDEGTYRGSG